MSEYLEFSKKLAREAGDIMLEHAGSGTSFKADRSHVTEADLKINQMVIDRVAEVYPEHSVRGEEDSNQQEGDEYVWVCDPIDGTRPYVMGVAMAMFSLALTHHGEPLVAVTYEPKTDKLYSAEKGKGAFMNDAPIRVSDIQLDAETGEQALIDICDMPNHPLIDLRDAGTALYRRKGVKVLGYRSSVFVGSLVSDGSLTAAITPTVHPHDIAAVALIIEEAGGKVTDMYGNSQRYDQPIKGAVMSNGVVHDQLIEVLAQNT